MCAGLLVAVADLACETKRGGVLGAGLIGMPHGLVGFTDAIEGLGFASPFASWRTSWVNSGVSDTRSRTYKPTATRTKLVRNGIRQQQRVDAEEIGGENASGLHPQELPPAGPVAARSGIDASSLENRPHGTCRNLVAKPSELAVDPPVAQEEFSEASRSTNPRSSGAMRRPPLRRSRG